MIRLIRFFLSHRLVAFLAIALTVGVGWHAFRTLPIDAYPDVTPTLVQVFAENDGLAPEEVERFVTIPTENAMAGLPGLTEMRTVSSFGLTVVNLYFEDGTDIYFARQLVGERLREARENLPEGYAAPELGPVTTGMGQILFFILRDDTGTRTPEEMRTLQDRIVKQGLQSVPGVAEVLSLGGEVRQIQIALRPDDLLRYGISVPEVMAAVRANNANAGAQYIADGNEEAAVRILGLAAGPDDLAETVIRAPGGIPIRLRQIADVTVGGELRRGLATADGLGEAVVGMVLKRIHTNTSDVIGALRERIETVNAALPEGVRTEVYYDQSMLVRHCIRTVSEALLTGMVLVTLVLLCFMGSFRAGLVPILSIPFSVLFALAGMKILGIGADLMSFGGLVIAIGMMVDAPIVIAEGVDRVLRESPEKTRRAVILTVLREVGRPIFFAVAVIVIVFMPLYALQGVEGRTFRPLAQAVSLGMLGSLLYSVFLAPAVAATVMGGHGRRREPLPARVLRAAGGPLASLALRGRVAVLAGAAAVLGGALWLLPRMGSEFVPRLEEGDLLIRITMAPSVSADTARDTVLRFERHLKQAFPEVSRIVTRIGRGEVGAHADPLNSAEAFISLRPRETWTTARTPAGLYAAMSHELEHFPGARFSITQPIAAAVDELVTGTKAAVAVKLFGQDPEALHRAAAEIDRLLRTVDGAADVQTEQAAGAPQLLILPDRTRLARHGLDPETFRTTAAAAIGGAKAGTVVEGNRPVDILVRYTDSARRDADAIADIRIPAPDGTVPRLGDLAEIRTAEGAGRITRQDGQRFVTVQCNVFGRDIGSFVEDARAAASALRLPEGVTVHWGGQFELRRKANARLLLVAPLTLAAVALIVYLSFASVRCTLLILMTLPLALAGGLFALSLGGQHLSVPASVGFIALFGIALEDAMILTECIRGHLHRGMAPHAAVREAVRQRIRPILMTTFTTALGMLPLLLSSGVGSEIQRPLALVICGGLVTSTLLTLLLIPALSGFAEGRFVIPRRPGLPQA